MKILFLTLYLLGSGLVFSQNDSLVVLSYQDYILRVKSDHPFAKQADLKINEGEASLLYAKGSFDPKAYTDIGQKYFNGTQYYSQINGGLKIPTWFGVELKGGYEQNQGDFLNSELTTPNNGLIYAGISVPIGQGLFIDKRRADLKKARLFQQITEEERQIILNELVFEAGLAYWKWFQAYNSLLVYQEAHRLANIRFEAVKLGARLGELPTIDTLEAGIQVQTRLLGVQQSQLKFNNASELLSIYLWDAGVVPLELAQGTIPVTIKNVSLRPFKANFLNQLDSLISIHPELNRSRLKIGQLEIDQRMNREALKPVLNLKYNPITEFTNENLFANYSINNYTWGMEFSMPIFLRKERGSVKLGAIKIQESNFKLDFKEEAIRYKVIAAKNQWETTIEQIELFTQTTQDYKGLLDAELRLFAIGESSLFMVNSREVGYIQTQLKLIELLTKNLTAELSTVYALGLL